ncbi:E3 ubiquitin ligase BIG BROTHER-related, partial [Mucuna pruriens]
MDCLVLPIPALVLNGPGFYSAVLFSNIYSCTFLCGKLHTLRRTKRVRMRRNQKFYFKAGEDYTDESLSYHFPTSEETSRSISRRRRDYKGSHLRKSLQPRKHLARVEISRDLRYQNKRNYSSGDQSYTSNDFKHGNYIGSVHDIKFVHPQRNLKNCDSILIHSNTSIAFICSQSTNFIGTSLCPSMEGEEGKQSSHKNPYVELEEVDFDFILAMDMQGQEREFTMLPTIESESDEGLSDSSFNNDDDPDFLESQEFETDNDDETEVEDDEIDPDDLSYEVMMELGEFIGEETRGLSANEVSLCLFPYTCYQCAESKSGIDRCVICQVEYEEGESLVALQCEHPYHADCISKWLQIKRVCPICSNEVSTPNMASNP